MKLLDEKMDTKIKVFLERLFILCGMQQQQVKQYYKVEKKIGNMKLADLNFNGKNELKYNKNV